jgi:hypothetical protein
MLLTGKNAMKYRELASDLIRRHLAGDPTLHKEINKNAASDAPMNSLARESMDPPQPSSIMEIDERISGLKRLREEGGNGVNNQAMMMQGMPMLMEQMVGHMTQACTKASETKVHVQDIANIQAKDRNQLFVDTQKQGELEFQLLTRKGELEIEQLTKKAKIRVDEAIQLAQVPRQNPIWRIRQPNNGTLFEPM